jgi:hypothetical protein
MGHYIQIGPDGLDHKHEGGKKLDLDAVKALIGNGCTIVERTPVKWEGRKRDCWLDEEGLYSADLKMNPRIRTISAEYWKVPEEQIQEFAGAGVIWVP